jgi:hypothetical protein
MKSKISAFLSITRILPSVRTTVRALGLLMFVIWGAGAADYPQRPVTIVVPFPAGGAADLLARLIAAELHDKLKQPFVIENRPGAGTTIAAAAVAKAVPELYPPPCGPLVGRVASAASAGVGVG